MTAFPNSSHLNILVSVSNSIPGAKQNPTCPACGCTRTVRKGKRRNRLQTLQVFQCAECLHRFTGEPGKNKTYPLKLILESVSTFNLGYSLTETQRLLRQRFHRDIPARTINSWLTEYRPLTTYARLRGAGRKHFSPDTVTRSWDRPSANCCSRDGRVGDLWGRIYI